MAIIWWDDDDGWGMEDGPVILLCGLAGALIAGGATETAAGVALGFGIGLAVPLPLLLLFALLLKFVFEDHDKKTQEGESSQKVVPP